MIEIGNTNSSEIVSDRLEYQRDEIFLESERDPRFCDHDDLSAPLRLPLEIQPEMIEELP